MGAPMPSQAAVQLLRSAAMSATDSPAGGVAKHASAAVKLPHCCPAASGATSRMRSIGPRLTQRLRLSQGYGLLTCLF